MTSLTRKNLLVPPLPTSEKPVACEQPRSIAVVTRLWVGALCLALLGYAVMGRGFAYLGVPPVFVGEMLMASGGLCLLVAGRWWPVLKMPQLLLLIVLWFWCGLRTVPFIREYGIDAMRDSIIYVYSFLSFVIAGVLICQPQLLAVMVNRYRYFLRIFLIVVPFAWIGFQFLGERLPTWPGTQVPILYLKAGDLQVHLGAVLAFMASEVAGVTAMIWFVPMFLNAAMLGPVNRGGMVSFGMALIATMVFKPFNRWAMGFIVVAIVGLAALGITGISFKIPGSERDISFQQLMINVVSVFSDNAGNLDEIQGTKEWRLDFWNAIIDDTVYGPWFWKGKGFGVNLLTEYGLRLDKEESVRAPHNGHITMLARTGVPGFLLWVALHLSWAGAILDCYIRSRLEGKHRWAGLFMFLLIYWTLIMINASFDPYIEGPMGGVWLWSVFGVGVAAMYLRTREPDLFADPEEETEPWIPLTALADEYPRRS